MSSIPEVMVNAAPASQAVRTDHSFQFMARARLRAVFPLFGAWGEREWAGPSWSPAFLYPQPPRDEPGAVFKTAREDGEAVWVNTTFDLEGGRAQYVYVVPGVQAVLIDLCLAEEDGGTGTLVTVRYRRTSLEPAMNAHVERLGREDVASAEEWGTAVNAALGRVNPERPEHGSAQRP